MDKLLISIVSNQYRKDIFQILPTNILDTGKMFFCSAIVPTNGKDLYFAIKKVNGILTIIKHQKLKQF